MAPDLDLLETDVEADLRGTVRGLLRDRCAPEQVTALYDGDRSLVETLWKSVAVELGLAGLLVPEELGGVGASTREMATVLEELGRACAPVPMLTSSVIATSALLNVLEHPKLTIDDAEIVRAELGALAAGERTAALVVALTTAPQGKLPQITVVDTGLSGVARSVAGAIEADLLLVPVQTADGVALYLVEASEAQIHEVSSLDMTRQVADVDVTGATGRMVLPDAEAPLRAAVLTGAALLASEQVGVARWCLETTVDYLKVRRQFGRTVGGFQALKHRLADAYTAVESASTAARYAAAALAVGQDVQIAARVAAAFCSDAAVHVAEEAIQLHGGIGMTWEHPAHLYLKKAKADQIALGTAGAHRAALGPLVDLPAPSAAR